MNKVIFVLLFVIIVMSGCKNDKKEQLSMRRNVQTAKSYNDKVCQSIKCNGWIEALASCDILPDAKGSIQHIWFKEGERVKKGQILYTISSGEIEAKIRAGESAVSKAKKEFEVQEKLQSCGNTSQMEYLSAKEKFEGAKANLAELRDKSEIRSPIDGIVGVSHKSLGTSVGYYDESRPSTKLCSVVDMSRVFVKFYVPVSVVDKISGSSVYVYMDGKIFETEVIACDITNDAVSKMFLVKVELKNCKDSKGLFNGKFVDVFIDITHSDSGLFVPKEAIFNDHGQSYVFFVKDGKAFKVPVVVGIEQDVTSDISITWDKEKFGDISDGMPVVISGMSALADGIAVETVANFGSASDQNK